MNPAPALNDAPFHLPPENGPTLDQIQREMAHNERVLEVATALDPDAFDDPVMPDQGWFMAARGEAETRFRLMVDAAIFAVRDEALKARRAAAIEFAERLLQTGAVRP